MNDETEFDNISLQLTDYDLAMIDFDCQHHRDGITPLQKYRKSGVLSVTDIVAPAW